MSLSCSGCYLLSRPSTVHTLWFLHHTATFGSRVVPSNFYATWGARGLTCLFLPNRCFTIFLLRGVLHRCCLLTFAVLSGAFGCVWQLSIYVSGLYHVGHVPPNPSSCIYEEMFGQNVLYSNTPAGRQSRAALYLW